MNKSPLNKNGYNWIVGKSTIHWGENIVIYPDKIVLSSGNCVFCCYNYYDKKKVKFYFEPKGKEEKLILDMINVKGGCQFSVVGDIDGYCLMSNKLYQ